MLKITGFIPSGRENAISMHDLANAVGTNTRTVRQMVHKARVDGEMICSSKSKPNGYYYPADVQEALAWYRMTRHASVSMLASLKTVRRYLKDAGLNPDEKQVRK